MEECKKKIKDPKQKAKCDKIIKQAKTDLEKTFGIKDITST